MLYTGNEQSSEKGHNPAVNNNVGEVTVTIGSKIGFWAIVIITLGLFYIWVICQKNKLNVMQMKINESASGIDVQLQKRFDTLTKIVDAVKGHVNFNKDVYENIAKLRSGNFKNTSDDIVNKSKLIDTISSGIQISVEAYPNLGADQSIQKLINESAMIERELAAARRLYNSNVTNFNSIIFTFPTSVIASKKKYHAIALFETSKTAREDVKINF